MIEAKFIDFENICIIENIVNDIIKLAVYNNENDELSIFINDFVDNCINEAIKLIYIDKINSLPSIKPFNNIIKKNKRKKVKIISLDELLKFDDKYIEIKDNKNVQIIKLDVNPIVKILA